MRRAVLLPLLLAISASAFAATGLDIDKVAVLNSAAPVNRAAPSGRANNVLEVVKISPEAAYVRTRLEFGTGVCAVSGLARVDGDALLLKANGLDEGRCELRIQFGEKIVFKDKGFQCSQNW